MDNYKKSFEYLAPLETVWKAITHPTKMREWYFPIEDDFVLKVGESFHFYGGDEHKRFLHECRIIEVKERELFKYTWSYPHHGEHESIITWRLERTKDGTMLDFTHESLGGLEAYGSDFKVSNFRLGWDEILGYNLRKYLHNITTLHFEKTLPVDAATAWRYMWSPSGYAAWTSAFTPDSQYKGNFRTGERVHLQDGKGGGMYTDVTKFTDTEVVMTHRGSLKDGKEEPVTGEAARWSGSREIYRISPIGVHSSLLTVEVDTDRAYMDSMEQSFPKALNLLVEKLKS